MGKKKKVAKKDKAVFRLVHRSQHDPLAGEGTQRVLVPINDNAYQQYDEIYQEQLEQEENGPPPLPLTDEDLFDGEGGKGKERELPEGVVDGDYDRRDFEYGHLGMGNDGYDYSQHMKSAGTGDVFIPAPKPRAYKKPLVGKNDTVNFLKEDKEKVLPASIFPSVMEGDTTLLHLQNFDSRPFLDKEILHQLGEEGSVSDASEFDGEFDGEIEDDFIALAEEEGEEGEEGEGGFGGGSSSSAPKRKPFVPDPEDCYDDEDDDDFDDGPPELEEYEEKQRMDPVVMNERQQDLEDQFQDVLAMYDEDDIGELDPEDPRLQGEKEIDQFEGVLDEHMETKGRQIRFGLAALDEEDGAEEARKQLAARLMSLNLPNDTVAMALETGTANMANQWDCQSITSLYSNTENHPSLIQEPPQIKLSSKTGIPLGYLGKHMNKKKKVEEDDDEEEDDDDDDDDEDEDEEGERVNLGEKRPKKESQEDKRARKQAAKKSKQEARVRKKEMKQEFSREKTRQTTAHAKDTFHHQSQIPM